MASAIVPFLSFNILELLSLVFSMSELSLLSVFELIFWNRLKFPCNKKIVDLILNRTEQHS